MKEKTYSFKPVFEQTKGFLEAINHMKTTIFADEEGGVA